MKNLGLYLHIPFCVKKCNYCDFPSFAGIGAIEQAAYVDALIEEIRAYGEEEDVNGRDGTAGELKHDIRDYLVDSIFIGGGTPSLLASYEIQRIMEAVQQVFRVADGAEITIEANPGTLCKEKLKSYLCAGINRLSLGLQSTEAVLLKQMGRIHTASDFFDNYSLARECGFHNINVDLIFGFFLQSLASWRNTVTEILSLFPEHLSFYSLQIEEGTPFYDRVSRGEFLQADDEQNRRMYQDIRSLLARYGYEQYEISNAARPGFACKHNLKYWSMEDYLGLGLCAHSFVEGVRFSNTDSIKDYLTGKRTVWIHKNDRSDTLSDYLFTQLRKIQGIDLADFRQRFGQDMEELYGESLEKCQKEGLLELSQEHLRLTDTGLNLSNVVLRELL